MDVLQGTELDLAVHLHHVDKRWCTESAPAKNALADLSLILSAIQCIQEMHEETLFLYCTYYFPPNTTKPPAAVKSASTVKVGDIVGGVDQRQLSQQRVSTHTENKICAANKDSARMIQIQDGSEKAETSGALERSRFTFQVNFPCITSKLGQLEEEMQT